MKLMHFVQIDIIVCLRGNYSHLWCSADQPTTECTITIT